MSAPVDNFVTFFDICASLYERVGARVSVRNTTLQFDNLITKCAMQDTALRDLVYDVLREHVPDSSRFKVYLKGGSAIAEMTNESEFYRGDIDIGVKHENVRDFEEMMFSKDFARVGNHRCRDYHGNVQEEQGAMDPESEKVLCGFDLRAMKIAFRQGIRCCKDRIIQSLISEWGRVRDFLLTGTLNEPGSLADVVSSGQSSQKDADDGIWCYLFDTYNSVLNRICLSRRRSKLFRNDFTGKRFFIYFFLI